MASSPKLINNVDIWTMLKNFTRLVLYSTSPKPTVVWVTIHSYKAENKDNLWGFPFFKYCGIELNLDIL